MHEHIHSMSCMLECSPCGFLFSFAYGCTWICVYVCVCAWEHVSLRVLNLCFALKDGEGGMGSQSVPLQINSLIPDPYFLQNTHYLQRLSFLPPPPRPSSLTPVSPLLLLYTLCLSLALCQSCYLHGFLCICVGEQQICSCGGRIAPRPFCVRSLGFKSFSLRKGAAKLRLQAIIEDEDVHCVWPACEKKLTFHFIHWAELNGRREHCFLSN